MSARKKEGYMPMGKPYKDAVREGQKVYAGQPAVTYIWTLNGKRFATANKPTDAGAKILAEIKSDGR